MKTKSGLKNMVIVDFRPKNTIILKGLTSSVLVLESVAPWEVRM